MWQAAVLIVKNGAMIATVWADSNPHWGTASSTIIVNLDRDEQLWLVLRDHDSFLHGYMYSTFSGFLIFENWSATAAALYVAGPSLSTLSNVTILHLDVGLILLPRLHRMKSSKKSHSYYTEHPWYTTAVPFWLYKHRAFRTRNFKHTNIVLLTYLFTYFQSAILNFVYTTHADAQLRGNIGAR